MLFFDWIPIFGQACPSTAVLSMSRYSPTVTRPSAWSVPPRIFPPVNRPLLLRTLTQSASD